MKIGNISIHIHRVYQMKWYRYFKPKRLTLECHPPIYKWLFWVIGFN